MKNRFISLILVLIFLSVACNLSNTRQVNLIPPSPAVAFNLATVDPNATATPTPFQPLAPTQTFLAPVATQTKAPPTPTPAGPVTPVDISITPAPSADMLTLPDGLVNILFFGSDFRAATGGYRTDTIILVSVNTKDGTVSAISFPRDLWVNIPGYDMQRINTAQAQGGFQMTQATFIYNFGIKPDFYVMTTFQGFSSVIDYLGGVDVNTAQNLQDRCDFVRSKWCSVGPGVVHMNSTMALWYIRARHTSSDIDRGRRAMEVLQAIFAKMMSLNNITKAPQLYAQFKSAFDTNMGLGDILPLLPILPKLTNPSNVRLYTIGYSLARDWVTPGGAMVLIPDLPGIRAAIQKTITGP